MLILRLLFNPQNDPNKALSNTSRWELESHVSLAALRQFVRNTRVPEAEASEVDLWNSGIRVEV